MSEKRKDKTRNQRSHGGETKLSLFVSSRDYFRDLLHESMYFRKLEPTPMASEYLARLLEYYITTDNLFDDTDAANGKKRRSTLAELFLRAQQSEPSVKRSLLKKLGDTSLYISGFFGDSLKRKIIDVDYYAELGGTAYGALAGDTDEIELGEVYVDLSRRFIHYVDVLTYISQKASIQSDADILRLYDRYIATGSELAREQLLEKGVLPSGDLKKAQGQ